jgi:hypothetical protein
MPEAGAGNKFEFCPIPTENYYPERLSNSPELDPFVLGEINFYQLFLLEPLVGVKLFLSALYSSSSNCFTNFSLIEQ